MTQNPSTFLLSVQNNLSDTVIEQNKHKMLVFLIQEGQYTFRTEICTELQSNVSQEKIYSFSSKGCKITC